MRLRVTIMSICIVVIGGLSRGQEVVTLSTQVGTLLRQFHAQDWPDRKAAFDQLIQLAFGGDSHGRTYSYDTSLPAFLRTIPDEADAVKLNLFAALEAENKLVQETTITRSSLSSDYLDYYANLITAVSAVKDQRAIPALLGAMTTGGTATRALASFGDPVLGPILGRFEESNPLVRSAVLFTVRDMLEARTLHKADSRRRIADALRSGINDRDPSVRMSAAWVIGAFGDLGFAPLLRHVADEDPAKLPGQGENGGDFYPVRHAARMALHELSQIH